MKPGHVLLFKGIEPGQIGLEKACRFLDLASRLPGRHREKGFTFASDLPISSGSYSFYGKCRKG